MKCPYCFEEISMNNWVRHSRKCTVKHPELISPVEVVVETKSIDTMSKAELREYLQENGAEIGERASKASLLEIAKELEI